MCGFRAGIVGKRAIGTSTPPAGTGIANVATSTSSSARSAIVRVATVRSWAGSCPSKRRFGVSVVLGVPGVSRSLPGAVVDFVFDAD